MEMGESEVMELESCPFCGSDGLELYRDFGRYYMMCYMCGVIVSLHYNKENSIRMWNRRVKE